MKEIDALILVIKAGGGYKYKTALAVQDGKDFNTLIAAAEIQLRFMAKSLEVAETMLREPAPSMVHPRWDEYQERRAEALREMMKKKDDGKKIPIRLQAVAETRKGPSDSLGGPEGNRSDRSADEPGGASQCV